MRDDGRYIPSGDRPGEGPGRRRTSVRAALRKLFAKVGKAEQLIGEIADELSLIIDQIAREGVGGPGGPGGKGPGGNRPGKDAAEPLPGVKHVEITRNLDGSAEVVIDGYLKIHLSQVLADLLKLLCEEGGGSPDLKVAWKTIDSLQKRLAHRGRAPLSRTAVTTRIHRLREALAAVVGHDLHVESSRRFGYRFAKFASHRDSADIF